MICVKRWFHDFGETEKKAGKTSPPIKPRYLDAKFVISFTCRGSEKVDPHWIFKNVWWAQKPVINGVKWVAPINDRKKMGLPGVSYNPYKWSEITPFIMIGSGPTLSILFVCDVCKISSAQIDEFLKILRSDAEFPTICWGSCWFIKLQLGDKPLR